MKYFFAIFLVMVSVTQVFAAEEPKMETAVFLPPIFDEGFENYWASNPLDDEYRVRVYKEFESRFSSTFTSLVNKPGALRENFAVGIFDNVKNQFEKELQRKGDSESGLLVTLGNISFLQFNMDDALDYYIRALMVNQNDPAVTELVAETFFANANYLESAKYFEKTYEILKKKKLDNSQEAASILMKAATSYRLGNELSLALTYSTEAMEIYVIQRGEADVITGDAAVMVGTIYDEIDERERALGYFRRGLNIYLNASYPGIEEKVSDVLNRIGLTYYYMGSYNDAVAQFKKVIELRKGSREKRSLELAEVYGNLAQTFVVVGFLNEALAYFKESYEIYLSNSDKLKNGTEVADILREIGGVYYFAGNYERSMEYLNQALSVYKSILGEEHTEVAAVYNNLGNVLYALKRYPESEVMFKKGLGIFIKTYGDKHLSVADSYTNIGITLKEQNRYLEARALIEKGLNIRKENLGEFHPDIADSLNFLGEVNEGLENPKEAIQNFKDSLEIKTRVFGEQSIEVAEESAILAFILSEDAPNASKKFAENARNTLIKLGRESHPLVFKLKKFLDSNQTGT